jgi:DNA-binding beta-propeller fold protein YncE
MSATAPASHYLFLARVCVSSVALFTILFSAAAEISAQEPELYIVPMHPRSLLIFDGGRDAIIGEIQTRGRNPRELVSSPDGKWVYATTESRTQIEAVNLQTRTVERVFNLAPPGYRLTIFGMTLSRKGDCLYLHVKPVRELQDEYKLDPPQIWSLDLHTGKTQKVAEVPQGVGALVVTGDGRIVASGRDLYYIDVNQGRIVGTFPLATVHQPDQGPLDMLAFFAQPERSRILSVPYYTTDPITGRDMYGLGNLDEETGKLDLVDLGRPPIPLYSTVVSPDRKRAYGVLAQLVAVDLEKRKLLKVVDLGHTCYIVNISRDGKKLYVSGAAHFIHVYDAETLKLLKTLDLPGDASIAFLALPSGAAR